MTNAGVRDLLVGSYRIVCWVTADTLKVLTAFEGHRLHREDELRGRCPFVALRRRPSASATQHGGEQDSPDHDPQHVHAATQGDERGDCQAPVRPAPIDLLRKPDGDR